MDHGPLGCMRWYTCHAYACTPVYMYVHVHACTRVPLRGAYQPRVDALISRLIPQPRVVGVGHPQVSARGATRREVVWERLKQAMVESQSLLVKLLSHMLTLCHILLTL